LHVNNPHIGSSSEGIDNLIKNPFPKIVLLSLLYLILNTDLENFEIF